MHVFSRSKRRHSSDRVPSTFEEQIYAAAITQGDVVFDIGANVGRVSLFAALLAGQSGQVYAFEPVWPAFAELCVAAKSAGESAARIVPVPVGLGDRTEMRQLTAPQGILELASLAPPDEWRSVHRITESETFVGAFTTLDTMMNELRIPNPDFAKIDVEGAELQVLQGATTVLTSARPPLMVLEVFAPWERVMGYHPFDLLSLLESYRYEFLFATPAGLLEHRPTRTNPFPAQYRDGYNVVAYVPDVHDQRMKELRTLMPGGSRQVLPMHAPPQPNLVRP